MKNILFIKCYFWRDDLLCSLFYLVGHRGWVVELWGLVFLDVKRRTSDQRRSQGVKRKYQKQKETRHLVVVDSDSNSEDNPKIRNEKVSRGKTQFEKKIETKLHGLFPLLCFVYGGSVVYRSSRRIRNPVVAALSPYQRPLVRWWSSRSSMVGMFYWYSTWPYNQITIKGYKVIALMFSPASY